NNNRGGADLRAAAMTVAELPDGLPYPGHRGFELTVPRDSAEYRAMLQRLEAAGVGGNGNGASMDRSIAADVFFGKGPGTPQLFSADRQMLNGLLQVEIDRRVGEARAAGRQLSADQARRAILDPANRTPAGRTPDVFTPGAAGFDVTDPVTRRT